MGWRPEARSASSAMSEAGRVSDPDGRVVVLPARIWDDKIVRDHPELRGGSRQVLATVANPPITSSRIRARYGGGSIDETSARVGG